MEFIVFNDLSYLTDKQVKKINKKYDLNLYEYENIYDIDLDIMNPSLFIQLFEEIEKNAISVNCKAKRLYSKDEVTELLEKNAILIDNMEHLITGVNKLEQWATISEKEAV